MASITPPAGMVDCNGCGGDGINGYDEEVRPYTCYRCCETGWMPVECLWEEPQVLANNINPQQHFLARYPRPHARYFYARPAYASYPSDEEIPF